MARAVGLSRAGSPGYNGAETPRTGCRPAPVNQRGRCGDILCRLYPPGANCANPSPGGTMSQHECSDDGPPGLAVSLPRTAAPPDASLAATAAGRAGAGDPVAARRRHARAARAAALDPGGTAGRRGGDSGPAGAVGRRAGALVAAGP